MDKQSIYITYELDKFQKNLAEVETNLDKLIFTMQYLQVYTQQPQTQFPEFWTEDGSDIAIKELHTRKFTPEQYMGYVMTLAKNAAVSDEERKKLGAAKAAGIDRAKKVFKMHLKGTTAPNIAAQLGIDIIIVEELLLE